MIEPDNTSLPILTWRGMLSPVRADVSTKLSPSTTTPSIGMRSPGFTMITESVSTSSGATSRVSLPTLRVAWSGRSFAISSIESCDFSRA